MRDDYDVLRRGDKTMLRQEKRGRLSRSVSSLKLYCLVAIKAIVLSVAQLTADISQDYKWALRKLKLFWIIKKKRFLCFVLFYVLHVFAAC